MMIDEISTHLRNKFKMFSLSDNIIFNNKLIFVEESRFQELHPPVSLQSITFIDGGQADILTGGNIALSFIRLCALTLHGNNKQKQETIEFFLLTTARFREGDIWYETKLFPVRGILLLNDQDLIIRSTDSSLRNGNERAPITKVAGMVRRFAELSLASKYKDNPVLLDGTLQPSFHDEERYISLLGGNVSALAKTCTLFTTSGNNPVILLQKISPYSDSWCFSIDARSYFVKLNPHAKHIFRFEGDKNLLPLLLENSKDNLFLGYPYGLILADKLARVSNEEKRSLVMKFLLNQENREITEYLRATNAHEILDNLG